MMIWGRHPLLYNFGTKKTAAIPNPIKLLILQKEFIQ